tara:strand:+ start:236 stop:496 length:261 start_codon:yes stop_codon:yes gene_type:complete
MPQVTAGLIQLKVLESFEQLLKSNRRFQPRKGRPGAKMNTLGKSQVSGRIIALDVESFRVTKMRLISVRTSVHYTYPSTFRDFHTV